MLKAKPITIILYLLPLVAMICIINLWPILYTLYLSFTNYSLFNADNYNFIGLGNYQTLISVSNTELLFVLGQTILYVVVCVALFVVIGMGTALALNNPKVKGLPVWRALLLVPYAVPSAISALIWKFLVNDDFGPINQILRVFFGKGFTIPWLSSPWGSFAAVVLVNLWLSYPFFLVVILGALQSVPQELNEAAAVDGANAWTRFRNVTLPLVRPAITPVIILSAITTFQMFNTVYLITKGGPTTGQGAGFTTFVMIYEYLNILGANVANPHYGLIAAFAIMLFVILGCLTFLARGLSDPDKKEAAA